MATTRQTSILPATVTYRLELSRLGDRDVSRDAGARRPTDRRPPVSIGDPTVHWDRAQTCTDEGCVAAATGVRDRLREDNQTKAPAEFRAMARQPELLAMADEAADRVLKATFREPLAAGGVAELMKLAGLDSIACDAPVTFQLTFSARS